MKLPPIAFIALGVCAAVLAQDSPKVVSIFDGKTLDGWDYDPEVWRVEDGAITGGSTTEKIKSNFFIATEKSYQNFELIMKIRCSGDPATGMINSGIQIRSVRVPGGNHMSGYQVDCGKGWFGKIYDEHRRRRPIAMPVDEAALLKVVDVYGWNRYRILAEGPRIRVWINDVLATDYTEENPDIALDGVIAPQVHSGGHCLVQFKNISIRELPPAPGAPTWESLGGVEAAIKKVAPQRKPKAKAAAKPTAQAAAPGRPRKDTSYNKIEGDPKTAAEQQKLFRLPEGYEIELVVQESEGIGKFISVYFDQRGRLWTQTALEYPVDANENAAAAEALYKSKARDKVLVYSNEALNSPLPAGGLTDPTVFADGLAIPLGLLPWGNGDSAYVLHGHDLLLLTDTDGDGKADKREVVLTGLGVQDSHLFPHQFTRAPGDWIWMAQGLFNKSEVKRPGEDATVPWLKCSMARMRPDGSGFEVTSTGPNNIWGLAMTGEGETFIQEANDFGYPVMAFHDYAYYPGGMAGLEKSYQPGFPPAAEFRMGGTGLSGLALLEVGPRTPKTKHTMLVANPIISKVQTLAMNRDGPRWSLAHLPDFVTCDDPFFRPVALTQGPEGSVYIVDWYNKIISHNEVPRNHPDRDKTRGRIWRINPVGGTAPAPAPPPPAKRHSRPDIPDFTGLSNAELLAFITDGPSGRSHLAWQTLADRNDPAVAAMLKKRLAAPDVYDREIIQAFWVLFDDPGDAFDRFVTSKNRNVRREFARHPRFAARLLGDPDPEVRFAVIQALAGQLPDKPSKILPQLLATVEPSLPGPHVTCSRTNKPILAREAYDREFERFLVRLFLERHPAEVAAFLDSDAALELPLEGRILASLALPPAESAPRVAALLPKLDRAPNTEELMRLAEFPEAPGCGEALAALLAKPGSRAQVAAQLLEQKTRLDPKKIAPLLLKAARALLEGDGAVTGVELIGAFQLAALEPDLVALVKKEATSSPDRVAALAALRQLRSTEVDLFAVLATNSKDATVRDAALAALAASPAPNAGAKLLELYPDLNLAQRRSALAGVSSSKRGARALVAALREKKIPSDELDGPTAERLAAVLGDDPSLAALMDSLDHVFREVLLLDGGNTAFANSNINLEGPFTVETWARLAPDIHSHDSLLGAPGVLDLNFFNSTFRVWAGPLRDVAISTKPMAPDLWTHLAVTRDAKGNIKIYTNGELDAVGKKKAPAAFANLKVGWSGQEQGTQGALAEFRVWNRERTAQEIRRNFDRSFADTSRPESLVFYNPGGAKSWGKLGKGARVTRTIDVPPLLTPAQAEALDAKFAKYMELGHKGGNAGNGKVLSMLCTSCHVINGQGGQIGPDLSGAGAMGLEGVLRNILTPNAAMEAGYRVYRVELENGEIVDAFFVRENKNAVVIRQAGLPDRRIPKSQIRSTRYIRRSLMPEGLLDPLSDEQAADLLAYLMTLK